MNKEIQLTFNREDLEHIYFKNDQGSYTKSPVVKSAWRTLRILLGITLLSLLFTLITDKGGYLMVLSVIGSLAVAVYYVRLAAQVYKWKQSIYEYIDKVESQGDTQIILTDEALIYQQGGKDTIEQWMTFKKWMVEADHIMLRSHIDYLFPKGSMTEEEFDYFTQFVSERVKSTDRQVDESKDRP